jgi:hypothetical protein
MRKDVFNQLSANLRGSVITPESGDYDAARKVYNGMIDRRPAAIARCADVAENILVAAKDAAHDERIISVADLRNRIRDDVCFLSHITKRKRSFLS